MRFASGSFVSVLLLSFSVAAQATHSNASHHAHANASHRPANCPNGIDVYGDKALQAVKLPPAKKCSLSNKNGFPMPDPTCTPGAVNPTITLDVLKNPAFTTECVRDQATQESDKAKTYRWYGIAKPAHNADQNQTCELDHFISLELGGADTLDNIWPQCGPSGVALEKRFFKRKDTVENFLAQQVRDGKMSLADAQTGIATDWTQYIAEAEEKCPDGNCN